MRKRRHLTLVVSAISIGAGLAGSNGADANPLSFHNTKPPELTIVGGADLERVNQKVEALRKRTEQARQNLEAANAHLRPAEAEYKAAKGEKEALILRQKASELASIADGEQVAAKPPKEGEAQQISGDKVMSETAQPVSSGTGMPAPATSGRIDPFEKTAAPAQDFNAQPQQGTLEDLQPSH